MPKTWLTVSHLRQQTESDCLPVCTQTADLSYWSQVVDHVVVVVGSDDAHVYVNDPSLDYGPHSVPTIEFELAQLNYDNLCTIIASTSND